MLPYLRPCSVSREAPTRMFAGRQNYKRIVYPRPAYPERALRMYQYAVSIDLRSVEFATFITF